MQPKRKVTRKVWRIFRFTERFELADDARYCRKSPLRYTRDYVGSGNDDESISYRQQINMLAAMPNRLMLRGAFHELKEIAANRSRCYRGYLLDEKLQPATEKKIGLWLGLDVSQVKQILGDLADVGLLERVPMPVFDESINELPGGDEPDPAGPSTGKKRAKQISSGARKIPKNSPIKRKRKTTKKTASGKAKELKEKNQSATAKGNETLGGSSPPHPPSHPADKAEADCQGNSEIIKLSDYQGDSYVNAEADRQSHQQETAQQAPATTQPMPTIPTGSDAQQAHRLHSDASVQPAGSVIDRIDQLYDPRCITFASEVFRALRVPLPIDSPAGRRELANYATAWAEAQRAGLPPYALAHLWDKSIKDACRMAAKRSRVNFRKSPEAVWRWLFGRRLDAAIRDGPQAVAT